MKQVLTFLFTFYFFTGHLGAQELSVFETDWNVFVYDKNNVPAYAGDAVSADVTYKDGSGNTIYSESHAGLLDDNSFISFIIGQGTNQLPFPLNRATYLQIASFSWTMTIETDEGPKVISGDNVLKPGLWATYSNVSLDSDALGGNQFISQPNLFQDVFNPDPDPLWSLMLQKNSQAPPNNTLSVLPLKEFMQFEKSNASVSGEEVDVIRFGKRQRGGYEENCYHSFGYGIPNALDALYYMCVPFLHRVNHLITLKIDDQNHPLPVPGPRVHNTGVLYALNKSTQGLSAGIIASAGTWGILGSGTNGVLGSSTGPGNGAAIWGNVANAPASGGFKYGILGDNGGFAEAWAAGIIGKCFSTVAWVVSSDERLKKEIRSQSSSLDKIMKLRPASYQYRKDNPYNLPDGVHHGFIAQEVEQVFPELVSNVPLPNNMNSEQLATAGATEYKGINYTEMISILTSAIQELNATLNEKIEAQAAEIEVLRKELEQVKGK